MIEVIYQPEDTQAKDTYILGSLPTSNYGTAARLIGGSSSTTGWTVFIGFPTLPLLCPSGSKVLSAKLTLRVDTATTSSDRLFIGRRVIEPWEENTLTAGNGPQAKVFYDWLVTHGSANVGGPGTEAVFDITQLVQGWVNNSYPNYGIAIDDNGVYTDSRKDFFSSASSVTAAYRPKLVIQYEPHNLRRGYNFQKLGDPARGVYVPS